MGTIGEQSPLLLHVLCGRTTSKLYSGCENAEGCLGKSEEDFPETANNGVCDVQIRLFTVRPEGQHEPVNILLYVDDLFIRCIDLEEIVLIKSQLASSFDMKDLGDLHYFLGIEVIRTLEGQQHYLLSMLFMFGMMECKSVSTPLDGNVKLCPDSGPACDPKRFQQIVRNLIYLTITGPNLSYPVGAISQSMAQPTVEHLQCTHHIVRYVSGTKDRRLLYRIGVAEQLVGYIDADWAGIISARRSTSGFVFSLGSVTIT